MAPFVYYPCITGRVGRPRGTTCGRWKRRDNRGRSYEKPPALARGLYLFPLAGLRVVCLHRAVRAMQSPADVLPGKRRRRHVQPGAALHPLPGGGVVNDGLRRQRPLDVPARAVHPAETVYPVPLWLLAAEDFPAAVAVLTPSKIPDAVNTAAPAATSAARTSLPLSTSYRNTPTPPNSRFAAQILPGVSSRGLSPKYTCFSSCTTAATTAPQTSTTGPMAISSPSHGSGSAAASAGRPRTTRTTANTTIALNNTRMTISLLQISYRTSTWMNVGYSSTKKPRPLATRATSTGSTPRTTRSAAVPRMCSDKGTPPTWALYSGHRQPEVIVTGAPKWSRSCCSFSTSSRWGHACPWHQLSSASSPRSLHRHRNSERWKFLVSCIVTAHLRLAVSPARPASGPGWARLFRPNFR